MFSLPTIWNLIISTIAFSIVAKHLHLHLDKREIARTLKRNLWVLVFASLVSWGAGKAADWAQEEIEGPPPAAQNLVASLQQPKAAD